MSARHRRSPRRRQRARRARKVVIAGLFTTVAIAAPSAAAAVGDREPPAPRAGDDVAEIAAGMPPGVLPGGALHARPAPRQPKVVLPVDDYRLTGRFGSASPLWRRVHTGLDFAAPAGRPVRAVEGGVVASTGYDGSYGNKTVVRLGDGTEIWYCHQSEIDVHRGQRVRAGQRIGEVGSTGNSTGPHLHLEVRPGRDAPVDPARWLGRRHLAV